MIIHNLKWRLILFFYAAYCIWSRSEKFYLQFRIVGWLEFSFGFRTSAFLCCCCYCCRHFYLLWSGAILCWTTRHWANSWKTNELEKKKANGIKADVVPLHCKHTNVWVVYFTVVVIADKERVQNAMTSQYQNWWLIMFVWFIYYIDTQRDVNKTKEWKNRFAACQTGNSKLDRYTQSIQYTTFVLFEVNVMNRRLIDIRTCNTAYCFAFAVFRSTTELSYSISCTLSAV